MDTPEEDPQAQAERVRARENAERERRNAAQGNSASLASDLHAVYGQPSLFRTVGK